MDELVSLTVKMRLHISAVLQLFALRNAAKGCMKAVISPDGSIFWTFQFNNDQVVKFT